jgi:hypothetical protein
VKVVRTYPGDKLVQTESRLANRLDDDSAMLRPQVDWLVDFEARFRHERGGDAHGRAVSTFPDYHI